MISGSLSRRAGGLFNSVRRLSQNLHKQGLKVSVIGFGDEDTNSDLPAWLPVRPIVLDASLKQSPISALHTSRAIARIEPDVVHQHGIWLPMSLATSRWASQRPTMISPRGMLDPWALANSRTKKRVAWLCWERVNLRRASCLHALAQAEADAIQDVLPGAPVEIVPNAVDLPTKTIRSQSSSKRKQLLFLGRIHPKKGLNDLFRQWAALPQTLRDSWRLLVAGPDENGHRAELDALVENLNIVHEIKFTGPLSGLAKKQAYEQADAFILPSHSEGLPMAVLEAWAAGLPVLMTRACNLPKGFEAGAATEIDTGDDPRLLKAALLRADLSEMGLRGRSLVEAEFTWDRVAARHAEIYGQMMRDQQTSNSPND